MKKAYNVMNVLWITNILLPEVSAHLAGDGVVRASGGWLSSLLEVLERVHEINLAVATVSGRVDHLVDYEGVNTRYFVIPSKTSVYNYSRKTEKYWEKINEMFRPDVVHIHGTEYPFGLAYTNVCGADKVVVSIQGMPTELAKYCKGGLSNYTLLKYLTLRDIIRKDSVFHEAHNMKLSGKWEDSLLRKVQHVIGRTSWDRAHSLAINPEVKYYVNNESLREPFYSGKWVYEKCNKHTIFVSQFHCPMKGFHILLKAMSLVKRAYPDLKVKVAGWDILRSDSPLDRFKISGYAKYIRKTIKKYKLEESIERTGPLNADDMKRALLDANVYVCTSSIENSPNSLGEAQVLGVPCVASFVGGIPDMMKGMENNLYRFDDEVMLSDKICEVFYKKESAAYDNSIYVARHNREENLKQLLSIYQSI